MNPDASSIPAIIPVGAMPAKVPDSTEELLRKEEAAYEELNREALSTQELLEIIDDLRSTGGISA